MCEYEVNTNDLAFKYYGNSDFDISKSTPLELTFSDKPKFCQDCDPEQNDLTDWLQCEFKFCPWCGRRLK